MVVVLELIKNVCLDLEFFCIYIGSLVEGFSGNYYLIIFCVDFDFMLIFNWFLYIVDEDKIWDDVLKLLLVVWVCYDSVW